jgi:hypothetical protein
MKLPKESDFYIRVSEYGYAHSAGFHYMDLKTDSLKSIAVGIVEKEKVDSVYLFSSAIAVKAQTNSKIMNFNLKLWDCFLARYQKGIFTLVDHN